MRRRGRKRAHHDPVQLPGPPTRSNSEQPLTSGSASIASVPAAICAVVNSTTRSVNAPAPAPTFSVLSAEYVPGGDVTTVTTAATLASNHVDGRSSAPQPELPSNRLPAVTDALSGRTGSSNREGLVLLANCAVSGPGDVTGLTQVKVEPEVVLADYELTAINAPEASFYERKRMMAAAETSVHAPSTFDDLHLPPIVTGSRSRSPSKDGGPLTLANGRVECQDCGRQYPSVVAYNKHAVQVHRSVWFFFLFCSVLLEVNIIFDILR